MNIKLAFDKAGAEIELPPSLRATVLEPRYAAEVPDAGAALAAAIRSPMKTPPLEELARGKKSAVIAVCDITRPAPNRLVLPHVTAALEKGGIPRSKISILIATGLHREATAAELDEIVGREMLSRYQTASHRARVEAEQVFLGQTTSGTKVYIDRRFVEADLHVTLGFIEPHLMLGFSGARKLVAPGLAAQETIKVLHSPKFMRDPRAVEGSIEDNPLHRELLEIAGMARHDFILDVALTRKREIAGVFAGHPVEAHARGVAFVAQVMLEQIEEPVDAVITTSAGYPLDLTFYQSIKGITAAAHIVKPGGAILLVAACEEGAGAPEFQRMLLENPSDQAFLDSIANAAVTVDQWQLEKLALVTTRNPVLFYVPGLPGAYHASLWGRACPSAAAGIEAIAANLERGATIAVIPEGPYVLARAPSEVLAGVR